MIDPGWLIREYEGKSPRELKKAPLHALQGLSPEDGRRLEEAFRIRAVADLAKLKYYQGARFLCDPGLSRAKQKEARRKYLLKAFQEEPWEAMAALPVHAIKGLSENDARLLEESFYTRTIGDLAELKFARWAEEIVAQAGPARKKARRKKKSATTSRKKKRSAKVEAAGAVSDNIPGPDLGTALRPGYEQSGEERPTRRFSGKWVLLILFLLVIVVALSLRYCPGLINKTGQRESSAPNGQSAMVTPPDSTPEQPPAQTGEEPPASEGNDLNKAKDLNEANGDLATDAANPADDSSVPVDGKNSYQVKPQDTLFSIAQKVYGPGGSWKKLYELNKDSIEDPNKIYAGQIIKLK